MQQGSASQNRLDAYAKAFKDLGHNVTKFYLITRDRTELNNCKDDDVFLWANDEGLIRKVKILSYIKNLLYLRKHTLKGDVILMYGNQIPIMLTLLSLKNKAKIYCEITEHPFHNKKSFFNTITTCISNKLLRHFDGLLVISESLRSYYISHGLLENAVFISNMFVDASRFNIEYKNNTESPYIAYCGKISFRKDGVNDLITAFSLFLKYRPSYKLKLIGGFENESVRTQILQLIRELCVEEAVELVGKVSPNEMPYLLQNACVLALARPNNLQSQNGFPTKLGEYLSTGNPVAVTRVGEIPNFLIDNVNAFLAEPDNPVSFSDALLRASYDFDKGRRVGQEGKKLCDSEFSNIEQSKRVCDFIEK